MKHLGDMQHDRKTNRQVLLSTNECDFLTKMQERLGNYSGGQEPCIMDALGAAEVRTRCNQYWPSCRDCVAKWLNEEAK